MKIQPPLRKRAHGEPTPVLLSLAETARRLGVCSRTVKRSIQLGRIHAVRLRIGEGRGVLRVPESEVERIIDEAFHRW